ncbi:MAG: ATP-binding protein [Rhodospirillales bacterium]
MHAHYVTSIIKVVILAVACGLGGFLAERYALHATATESRLETAEELGTLRARIESLLNADVQLVRGLVSYVKARPGLDQKEFSAVASDLTKSSGGRLRNIALAKDLVISHVYPVVGNEKALGLEYRKVLSQWPQVEKAISENIVVIAGPLKLVQGGVGIVARFPVYLTSEREQARKLWGIVSTVIDFDAFVHAAKLWNYAERYNLALIGRDGAGRDGSVFWGDAEVLDDDPVFLDVHLVNGTWAVAAQPRDGWPGRSELFWVNVGGALMLFAVGIFIIYSNLRYELETERSTALLEQARKEAEAAKDSAQQANRAKSQFLAAMSHELRTPLNAILGFSDIIHNQYFGPPGSGKYREYAGDIHSSAQHLLDLVNDVLDISAIEAGKTALEITAINVESLLGECVHTVRERASQKTINLELVVPAKLPELQADRRAIKQVLLNLLSNAVKFTPENGTVRVKASAGEKSLEIVVADTGIGIEPERLPHIIAPFTGDRQNPYTSERGWGLGLSISKSLIDLHKGRMTIQSRVGHGTTVILRLHLDSSASVEGEPARR